MGTIEEFEVWHSLLHTANALATMYILHSFCQSGNAYKVAFLLNALNVPWQAKFVDFMNGITRTGAWRESINDMGEVPVLDDGALRLTQSGVILTYLAEKHGAFAGKDENEKREVLRWILFHNHKFTSYFASYRFMKSFGPSAPDTAVMSWLRGRMDGAFNVVNRT
jgi:glutathione S-transferase